MTETVPPIDVEALDAVILAHASPQWSKVAVFLAIITDATRAAGFACTSQDLAQRIYAMVEAGSLEAQGNVRRWRSGQVRKWIPGRAAMDESLAVAPEAVAANDAQPAEINEAAKT